MYACFLYFYFFNIVLLEQIFSLSFKLAFAFYLYYVDEATATAVFIFASDSVILDATVSSYFSSSAVSLGTQICFT